MFNNISYYAIGIPSSITPNISKQTCPACSGTGIQTGKDGITIICPVCGGSGQWSKPGSDPYYTWDTSEIKTHNLKEDLWEAKEKAEEL